MCPDLCQRRGTSDLKYYLLFARDLVCYSVQPPFGEGFKLGRKGE